MTLRYGINPHQKEAQIFTLLPQLPIKGNKWAMGMFTNIDRSFIHFNHSIVSIFLTRLHCFTNFQSWTASPVTSTWWMLWTVGPLWKNWRVLWASRPPRPSSTSVRPELPWVFRWARRKPSCAWWTTWWRCSLLSPALTLVPEVKCRTNLFFVILCKSTFYDEPLVLYSSFSFSTTSRKMIGAR